MAKILSCIAVAGALLLPGVALADEKGLEAACANLGRLAIVAGDAAPTAEELDACKRDLGQMNASCTNGDEVLACIAGVDGKTDDEIGSAFLDCAMKCQELGAPPKKTTVASAGVQKACDNLAKLATAAGEEVRPDEITECLDGIGELVGECSNGDAVLACFAGATSEDGFVACIDQCAAP